MADPGHELDVTLNNDTEAFVGIRFVAGNPGRKLRNKAGVVEFLLFLYLEVRFGTAQPKKIAMKNDFSVIERSRVIIDEAFQSEREQAVHAAVDETLVASGLFVEKMGERSRRQVSGCCGEGGDHRSAHHR